MRLTGRLRGCTGTVKVRHKLYKPAHNVFFALRRLDGPAHWALLRYVSARMSFRDGFAGMRASAGPL